MLFKKSRKLQVEIQQLTTKANYLEYQLDSLRKELETVKASRSKWREKAHNYRRQRSHLARQLQTQRKAS